MLYIASDYNSKFKLFSASFLPNNFVKTNESDFLRLDLFQKNNLYYNSLENTEHFYQTIDGWSTEQDQGELLKTILPLTNINEK